MFWIWFQNILEKRIKSLPYSCWWSTLWLVTKVSPRGILYRWPHCRRYLNRLSLLLVGTARRRWNNFFDRKLLRQPPIPKRFPFFRWGCALRFRERACTVKLFSAVIGSTVLLMLSVSVAGNMGLGWKRVTVTNGPEYFTVELITVVKSFIVQAPGTICESPVLESECDRIRERHCHEFGHVASRT